MRSARARRRSARGSAERSGLQAEGGSGFDGFNARWHESIKVAFETIRAFALARPLNARGVFLTGSTGLGKTRLLLASHMALLEDGIRSAFVTSADLRKLVARREIYDLEAREEAEDAIARVISMQVVHLDDLGDVGDPMDVPRPHLSETVKDILEQSKAAFLVATNCTGNAALEHPDIGRKVVSRLMGRCDVLKVQGRDYRIAGQERKP